MHSACFVTINDSLGLHNVAVGAVDYLFIFLLSNRVLRKFLKRFFINPDYTPSASGSYYAYL